MTQTDRMTVLVVDDDPDVLLALSRRLHAAGFEVVTASSGAEALELIGCHTVNAITLDVSLPGEMNGLELAAALRRNPRTAETPIVFVTGTVDSDFKEKCTAVGGEYFLAKPYDADVLIRLLDGIFGQDELAEIRRISEAKRRQPTR